MLEAAEAVIGGAGGGKSSRKERRVRPMMSTQNNLPYIFSVGEKNRKTMDFTKALETDGRTYKAS